MEELDLTNSNWIPENEIYLISIIEGVKDLYPDIDFDVELEEMGFTNEDILKNPNVVIDLIRRLSEKYPEDK
jgi:hypothetical protein